jgi:biotin-dependent carboxylase-like uncharacterized protein
VIKILAAGAGCSLQDRGRPGWAALGVGRSGAFDLGAADLANRLVGNDASAAVFEVVLGGLALRTTTALTVALTGARCPVRSRDAAGRARDEDWAAPITLAADSTLELGTPAVGLRSWLAVRGGLDVPPVLGSRSRDALSGMGPALVAAGASLRIGTHAMDDIASTEWAPTGDRSGPIRISAGPREDWVTTESLQLLVSEAWTVRPDSNRIGIRLEGRALTRRITDELPSEGVLPGAVQLPPDGRPIIFGPDAPVTGGYPVIAVVRQADLGILAQLRPGDSLRLIR